jgi:uncharacterized protein (DUF2236 family)
MTLADAIHPDPTLSPSSAGVQRKPRPAAPNVDYCAPKGDPGLFGPESVAWRVHANPVGLAVGGIAAVILELAEPRVRTGVWEHSTFRTDPLSRMRRTGDATMITTYGPTAAAKARIAMVNRMHERVGGKTPEGQAYRATDPDILTWVHVTASYGFLNGYLRFVNPALSREDQDRYYAESQQTGTGFGAVNGPRSVAEADDFIEDWRKRLAPHEIIGEFLQIVSTTSPIGPLGRLLQPLVVEGALDILPPWARAQLNLPSHPTRRAAALPMLRAMGRLAKPGATSIPAQAYQRMDRPLAR